MTVVQALSIIIDRFGIDILGSPNKIHAMVLDYAVDDTSDNVGVFCSGCRKEILSIAQQIYKSNDNKKALLLALNAKTLLMGKQYMQEKYAVICVNMILEGIGSKVRLELSQIDKHESNAYGISTQADGTILQKQKELSEAINDNRKADCTFFQLLLNAEKEGDITAMIRLGECYQYGKAVSPSRIMAEHYYRKAKQTAKERNDKRMVDVATQKLIKLYNLSQCNPER